MNKHPRLNNDDFIALRSVCREPWISARGFDGTILWKFNGKWFRVDQAEVAMSLVDDYAWSYKGSVWARAYCALDRIEAYGLVESNIVRCCPDTDCHLNDRLTWNITERGRALLARANKPASTAAVLATTVDQPPPGDDTPPLWAWLTNLFKGRVAAHNNASGGFHG